MGLKRNVCVCWEWLLEAEEEHLRYRISVDIWSLREIFSYSGLHMQLYGVIHRQNHFKVLSVWFRDEKKVFLWSKPITQGIQKNLILAPNYISLLLQQPAPTGLNTVNANKHTMEFNVRFQCLLGRDSDKPSLIGLIWSSWRLFQTFMAVFVHTESASMDRGPDL